MNSLPASTDVVPASPASASDAAELIHQTDPGVWNYLFAGRRGPFERFARGLWRLPGNSFSHSESLTVRHPADGTLLGLEMGYRGADEPALRARMREAVMGFMPEDELGHLVERAEDIDYLTPYIPPDAYYVHFLSVRPEARGRGLGVLLLENALRRAAGLGCDAVHLDVYHDNPAVGLYRRHGFRVVVETRFPHKSGLPPHFRMARAL